MAKLQKTKIILFREDGLPSIFRNASIETEATVEAIVDAIKKGAKIETGDYELYLKIPNNIKLSSLSSNLEITGLVILTTNDQMIKSLSPVVNLGDES